MSAIPTDSGEAPARAKVTTLIGLLALAAGLPFLGLFVLRYITSVRQFAELSALGGNVWTWREYAAWWFMSPVVAPALWCAGAAYAAVLRTSRPVRAAAGLLLAAVVAWAVALAVRIATI